MVEPDRVARVKRVVHTIEILIRRVHSEGVKREQVSKIRQGNELVHQAHRDSVHVMRQNGTSTEKPLQGFDRTPASIDKDVTIWDRSGGAWGSSAHRANRAGIPEQRNGSSSTVLQRCLTFRRINRAIECVRGKTPPALRRSKHRSDVITRPASRRSK